MNKKNHMVDNVITYDMWINSYWVESLAFILKRRVWRCHSIDAMCSLNNS